MKREIDFNRCCAIEIRRVWKEHGGSMNIVSYINICPECGHFIGLTQTSKEDAKLFLEKYNLNI